MGGLWRAHADHGDRRARRRARDRRVPVHCPGFFSKEEILAAAADTPGGRPIWVIGIVVAGSPRSTWAAGSSSSSSASRAGDRAPGRAPARGAAVDDAAARAARRAERLGGLINLDPADRLAARLAGPPASSTFEARAEFLPHATLLVVAVLAGARQAWPSPGTATCGAATSRASPPEALARGCTRWRTAFYVDELYEAAIAAARASARRRLRGSTAAASTARSTARERHGRARRPRPPAADRLVRSYALAVLAGDAARRARDLSSAAVLRGVG
jgi:NADH-quinone oxidoreductase subunit L